MYRRPNRQVIRNGGIHMASQRRPVPLCTLCQQVYDPHRYVWVQLKEYRTTCGEPAEGYTFTETFCDTCRKVYTAMIGVRKEALSQLLDRW